MKQLYLFLICFLSISSINAQQDGYAYYTVKIDKAKLNIPDAQTNTEGDYVTYTLAIDRSKMTSDLKEELLAALQKKWAKTYSGLTAENLQGQIRSIEQNRYSFDPLKNEWLPDSCCVFRMEYNQMGNMLKRETLTLSGIMNDYVVCSYHDNGLLKEQVFYNKNHQVTYREMFNLDANGNYVDGLMYNEAGDLHRKVKIEGQNAYGQWTKVVLYTASGELYRTEEYTYEGWQLLRTLWTNKEGKVIRDDRSTYNDKGELEYTKMFNAQFPAANGETFRRADQYDELGNWTQTSILDASGKPTRLIKRKYTYR